MVTVGVSAIINSGDGAELEGPKEALGAEARESIVACCHGVWQSGEKEATSPSVGSIARRMRGMTYLRSVWNLPSL